MTVKDMKARFVDSTVDHISEDAISASATTMVPADSLIVATRMSLGKIVRPKVDVAINQDLKALFLGEGVEKTFIEYFWRSKSQAIQAMGTGTTVKGIRLEDIRALAVPLAPKNEQKRIADKLDTVLTRVDAVNTRLARVAPLLKRFRQSVLAAATTGRLTEDWRHQSPISGSGNAVIRADALAKASLLCSTPSLAKKKSTTHSQIDENYLFDLPSNWSFSTWGQISEWITYGFTRPMPSSQTGVRLLTAKDVHPFEVRVTSAGFTESQAFLALSEKDKPLVGDLLITKDGSIGRAALVGNSEPFCINQSVAVCWLRSTSMNKKYLEVVVNADFTQRFVVDMAKGMAIQHLSIVDFACCPVPVPPLSEQTEIVRRVETLFAFADRLETRLQAAQTAADRLTPSLLAKAFHGELVPQDPNDEPASELLKRLTATSAQSPSLKRGRKSSA
jgi:type I restriction enzyme S subunit